MDTKIADKILTDLVGSAGVESLKKAVYHRDSTSELGPLDLYLPLMVVPRTILSWLVQNIRPMKQGDSKELAFPGNEDISIHIDKQGRDSYRAEFQQDGKIIHTFEKQTLPNVGGHMLTVGEMYESFVDATPQISSDEEAENSDGHVHDNPEGGHTGTPEPASEAINEEASGHELPGAIVKFHGMRTPFSGQYQSMMGSSQVEGLVAVIGKLVDALVANHLGNTVRVSEPKPMDKDELGTKEPGGRAKPQPPKPPKPAVGASNMNPVAATRKQGQANRSTFIPKKFTPKKGIDKRPSTNPGTEKGIYKFDAMEPSPSGKVYFKEKLQKLRDVVEKKEFHVHEHELYTPCMHCGLPEFKKSEKGPKYQPCACFMVTLKSEEGANVPFVTVVRKQEGGVTLKFNPTADQEVVRAFLKTLKSRLLKHKTKTV